MKSYQINKKENNMIIVEVIIINIINKTKINRKVINRIIRDTSTINMIKNRSISRAKEICLKNM